MTKDRAILLGLIIVAVIVGAFLDRTIVESVTDRFVGRLKV